MATDLTVVLATYNRRPILERTLEALDAQSERDFDIVVVDDGSSDDTWPWLQARAAQNPRLTVERQANAGQGQARNRALRRVAGGLVLFLGDDIIARPELISEHRAAHAAADAEPGATAVVGFTDWHRAALRVTPLLEMINREGHQFGYGHMNAGAEVPFTCFYTSNISLPRALLGEAPFDSAFAEYGWEDVELGYRLARDGLKILYHPQAAAEHLHAMDLPGVFARQRQVGRGIHTLLALHPELADSPHLAPSEAPRWQPLGRHLIPPLLPVLNAVDRAGLPLSKRLWHRVLMCGYYLGRDEASPQAAQPG
ncbi:MAG: glycosyltransferase family A protein [Acidobacteriota bacterium]